MLGLIEQKADLQLELTSLKRDYKQLKMECQDRIDEVYNQNSLLNNQMRVLNLENIRLMKKIKEIEEENDLQESRNEANEHAKAAATISTKKSAKQKQSMRSIESDEEDICNICKSNHRDQSLEYDLFKLKNIL